MDGNDRSLASCVITLATEIGASTLLGEGNQGGGPLSQLLVAACDVEKVGRHHRGRPEVLGQTRTGSMRRLDDLIYADKIVAGALLPECKKEWSAWAETAWSSTCTLKSQGEHQRSHRYACLLKGL